MSFSYTPGGTADIDRLRFGIPDTAENDADGNPVYVFEDAELTDAVTLTGSVSSALIYLLQILLTDQGMREKKFKIPGVEYDDRGKTKWLSDRIGMLGGSTRAVTTRAGPVLPVDANYVRPTTATCGV